MSRLARVVLAAALLLGCARRTSAIVEVDADEAVRAQTRSVTVWVRAGESRVPRLHRQIEADSLEWPLYVVMIPDDDGVDDDAFRVGVRAHAESGGEGRLLSSRYLVGEYLPDVDGLYPILLDADCADVECNEPLDETCYYGACVSGEHGPPTEYWSGAP